MSTSLPSPECPGSVAGAPNLPSGFGDTFASLVTYLPVVLTALAVLTIGWLLAILLRGLVRRALESMDWLFARLMPRST